MRAPPKVQDNSKIVENTHKSKGTAGVIAEGNNNNENDDDNENPV